METRWNVICELLLDDGNISRRSFCFLFPVNWCQHWFEFFPNPPINVLSMVENLLAHHDKELLNHLMNYNITSQVPFLTLFWERCTLCLGGAAVRWDGPGGQTPQSSRELEPFFFQLKFCSIRDINRTDLRFRGLTGWGLKIILQSLNYQKLSYKGVCASLASVPLLCASWIFLGTKKDLFFSSLTGSHFPPNIPINYLPWLN